MPAGTSKGCLERLRGLSRRPCQVPARNELGKIQFGALSQQAGSRIRNKKEVQNITRRRFAPYFLLDVPSFSPPSLPPSLVCVCRKNSRDFEEEEKFSWALTFISLQNPPPPLLAAGFDRMPVAQRRLSRNMKRKKRSFSSKRLLNFSYYRRARYFTF